VVPHYLVTGHTGFKGSWLSLLLKSRGHTVSGLALDPPIGGLFDRAGISFDMEHDLRVDVRDREEVIRAFKRVKPDFVIHMAAQALVREGYRDPLGTYETNVNGTLNILQASDQTDSITSQLIVTTDKVYRDSGGGRSYVESDPLGGNDPYSASKAAADIMAQEFLQNQRTKPGFVVRGGNVVGAGDVSRDRLIPDLLRSVSGGEPLIIRYPNAVRPWQHVLDCLEGYLSVLARADSRDPGGPAWNIGPSNQSIFSVQQVVEFAKKLRGFSALEVDVQPTHLAETDSLSIDSGRAQRAFGWENRLTRDRTLQMALTTVGRESEHGLRELVNSQIASFETDSTSAVT